MTNENVNSYKNTSRVKIEEGNFIYADDVDVPNGRGMMKDLLNELNIKSKHGSLKLEEEIKQE